MGEVGDEHRVNPAKELGFHSKNSKKAFQGLKRRSDIISGVP